MLADCTRGTVESLRLFGARRRANARQRGLPAGHLVEPSRDRAVGEPGCVELGVSCDEYRHPERVAREERVGGDVAPLDREMTPAREPAERRERGGTEPAGRRLVEADGHHPPIVRTVTG